MIAVDSNLLIYAYRPDSVHRGQALRVVTGLAEGSSAWAIPWPCIHEFIGVVTHSQVFKPPSTMAEAFLQIEYWMESPTLTFLSESPGYWERLQSVVIDSGISGPAIHDAKIAAICLHHGVRELWTADRNFGRFPALTTRNPLVGSR